MDRNSLMQIGKPEHPRSQSWKILLLEKLCDARERRVEPSRYSWYLVYLSIRVVMPKLPDYEEKMFKFFLINIQNVDLTLIV
jgi:hypothetical protein